MSQNGSQSPTSATEPLVSVRDVKKHFPIRDGVMQRVTGQVRAVDGVSFDLLRGSTLGLVGESGCGKTTLGRLVAGLTEPTSGGVYFDGGRVDELRGDAARSFRRNCQMVFQDSFSSLNPRHLVKDLVGRPLKVYREASGSELTERVVELLESVGLGRQHLYRYPHQFSGGQRQRISIARALALDPALVVLDEPTSALDVSVQAQILNLLHELQTERDLTFLFITHDLSVVRHMAEHIVVMYLGQVAEAADTESLFERPLHPYSHALLQASPDVVGDGSGFKGLEGSVPDPARPPSGCRFHTRCSYATPTCGWDIDDVVRRLEDIPQLFDELVGVERASAFDAELQFENQAAAVGLATALGGLAIPDAMTEAMQPVVVTDNSVRVRFHEVPDVELSARDVGREVACVLEEFDPDQDQKHSTSTTSS